ncbi:MAG: hypothetical protein DHS20C12_11820 [Pseudohongiella sp.]|nr:MAG: hypothetical protein DHS20C12_11820 [Pseudohongiella sp.]
MSFFVHAYSNTFKMEGGKANHPADRGRDTQFGISLRFMESLPLIDADINGDGHVTADDVYSLDPSTAAKLYKKYFWDHYRLDEIEHQRIAIKLFDTLVNMRSKMAVKIVQRGLRACEKEVSEDGILGSQTIATINSIVQERNLLTAMRSEQWGIYRLIIAKDPTQSAFENGWKNRAYS